MKKRNICYLLFAGLLATSCASTKKMESIQSQLDDCVKENNATSRDLTAAQVRISNLAADSSAMQKRLEEIIADTVRQSKELHQSELQLASLQSLYNQLNDQLGKSNSQGEKEIKALLSDLQKSQEKLQVREDALLKAENDLQTSAKALAEKEKKVEYLSKKINEQDSLMRGLRQKVATALKGYVGNGLEVVNKNGKVYVSMDEKLLFHSGSWEVDEKGVAALENISKLLADNKDLQVVIEGHTDDLPYRGYGNVDDNWDLSTKRATSIVRILLRNEGIAPSRVTASGRAEFVPIDTADTREARQRNRRTEIIISPNIDEIMKVIGGE
ncbi:MAG: OmpA family protein [Paludibacteraceae bacterium]|nr:OmpA family protein [Paludibacteraceae bacterium]